MAKIDRDENLEASLRSLGAVLRSELEPETGEARKAARSTLARLDLHESRKMSFFDRVFELLSAPQLAGSLIVILSLTIVAGKSERENPARVLSSIEALLKADAVEDELAALYLNDDIIGGTDAGPGTFKREQGFDIPEEDLFFEDDGELL